MNINCEKCSNSPCTCKKSIHELAKANPNKTYREVEKMHEAEDLTYENNSLVIDDTNECESCQ